MKCMVLISLVVIFAVFIGFLIYLSEPSPHEYGIEDSIVVDRNKKAQKELHSWIKESKRIDIHNAVRMVKVVTASRNSYYLPVEDYSKYKDSFRVGSTDTYIKKDMIEEFEYFVLGDGMVVSEDNSRKQAIIFRMREEDYQENQLDEAVFQWVLTYPLYRSLPSEYHDWTYAYILNDNGWSVMYADGIGAKGKYRMWKEVCNRNDNL